MIRWKQVYICFLLCFPGSFAETELQPSTGTEFWLAFPYNNQGATTGLSRILITSENSATVTASNPAGTGSAVSGSVGPGAALTLDMANTLRVSTGGVETKGIKVTADEEINVYMLNLVSQSADGTIVFPVDYLGTEHVIAAYSPQVLNNQFTVVAAEAALIEIYQTVTGGGWSQLSSYTLAQGETYTYSDSTNSVNGWKILSKSGNIAVFSGNDCVEVQHPLSLTPTRFISDGCDHLVEQIPEVTKLGKTYITPSHTPRSADDIYQVTAVSNNTSVYFSVAGLNATLHEGQSAEFTLTNGHNDEALCSENCLVVFYNQRRLLDRYTTDPFMIVLPSTSSYSSNYRIGLSDDSSGTAYTATYVEVIVASSKTGSIMVNGASPSTTWTSITGTAFSAASVALTGYSSVTSSDEALSFAVYVHQNSYAESVGYCAGWQAYVEKTADTSTLAAWAIGLIVMFALLALIAVGLLVGLLLYKRMRDKRKRKYPYNFPDGFDLNYYKAASVIAVQYVDKGMPTVEKIDDKAFFSDSYYEDHVFRRSEPRIRVAKIDEEAGKADWPVHQQLRLEKEDTDTLIRKFKERQSTETEKKKQKRAGKYTSDA